MISSMLLVLAAFLSFRLQVLFLFPPNGRRSLPCRHWVEAMSSSSSDARLRTPEREHGNESGQNGDHAPLRYGVVRENPQSLSLVHSFEMLWGRR